MKDFITNNFVPLVGCLLMSAFVMKNDRLSKIKRRFFMATLYLFVISLIFRNADYITSTYEHYTIRRAVYSALGYISRAMVIYGLIGTDLNLKYKIVRLLYFMLGIPIVITVISAVSVFFTDSVYSFTDTNHFVSGPLGWLNYLPVILYMIVLIGMAIHDVLKKHYQHAIMLFATTMLMLAAILFEYFSFREFTCEAAVTMALMLYLIFFQNAEFMNAKKSLEHKAMYDSLTNLYNRSGYDELMKRFSKEGDLMVGMLVIDIDKFKEVNDTYGHDVGDRILKNTAKLLNVTFRSSDYVIRYGGDEFVVIMIGITESLAFVVKNKIESINVQIENPISSIPKTTVSAGLAFSENGLSQELFKQADEALYYTKTTTRRGCTLYSDMVKSRQQDS